MIDNNTDGDPIISNRHDFNTTITRLSSYVNHDNTAITTGNFNGEPIVNYYYNHLCSINDVYDALNDVFACEIELFKLNFRISGVFEMRDIFGGYSYTTEQIYWNANTDIKPIIIKSHDDLMLVKEYINTALIQYKTMSSKKLLSIVETIAFIVSRILRINSSS